MKNTENKTKFVIVRVTPSEKKSLMANAKKSASTLSQFIRKVIGLEK